MLAGLAVGVVFLRRQRTLLRSPDHLQLFRNATFTAALATNVLDFFVGFGIFLSRAVPAISARVIAASKPVLWTAPWAIGFIVGSMLTPAARAPDSSGLRDGGWSRTGGCGLRRAQRRSTRPRAAPVLVTRSVLLSLGLAPMTTLATDIMVGMVPPERAGARGVHL